MPVPIKVAIVEDDSGIRQSMAVLINGAPDFRCVGAYPSAEIALREIPQQRPDIVLMDINLPQMSGIECVRRLKAAQPSLQVLMLTVYMDSDLIFQSLTAGASGYLIKQTAHAEVLEALLEVHRGGAPMSTAIARKVVQYFHQKETPPPCGPLTKREHEILLQLAKGYHDKEIAQELSISTLTVRTHIKNSYEKLHVHSRAGAVARFLSSRDGGFSQKS